MIPKIAFFHWDGPPMGWLRSVGVATFARHNPDWEIRIIRTMPGLTRKDLKIEQKADITWWHALRDHGGFAVSTDIVFTAPIPDAWLAKPMCACLDGAYHIRQLAVVGFEKGHPAVTAACDIGLRRIASRPHLDWQDLGIALWETVSDSYGDLCDQPMGALCPYDEESVDALWMPKIDLLIPEGNVGVHWYGGHDTTRRFEGKVGPNSEAAIVCLAMQEMGMSLVSVC